MPRTLHIVRSSSGGLRVVAEGEGSDVGNIFADAAWAAGAPFRHLRVNAAWAKLRAAVERVRRGGMPPDMDAVGRAVRLRSEIRRLQSRRGFTPAEAAEYRDALLKVASGGIR